MPANIDPMFTRVADIQWALPSPTANALFDGTGVVSTVFTADAVNGGFVMYLKAKPTGASVQSSLRIFINNGASSAVAANNIMFAELALPNVSSVSQSTANPEVMYPFNIALPPGYKVNVAITTTVAATWAVCVVGGKY